MDCGNINIDLVRYGRHITLLIFSVQILKSKSADEVRVTDKDKVHLRISNILYSQYNKT